MKNRFLLVIFAAGLAAPGAFAQERSRSSAQEFIRESLAVNAKAMMQLEMRGEGPWGVVSSVASASECSTAIGYEHGTILIDWGKVQTLGAQSPSSPQLWVQGERDFIVVIGGLGPGSERVRFATLTPSLNSRVADAMNYLKDQCNQSARHGF